LKPTQGAGYLLDGFPRTLPQARKMDEALGEAGEKVDMVLSLAVPDELIVERITGRLTAPKSGMVYHKKYKPPKVDGICDVSGEQLVQREDDTEKVVRERLRTYHEQTAPLEEYYREKGVLHEVDGTKSIDEISQQITKLVKDYQAQSGR
jgi:adenylate kinase